MSDPERIEQLELAVAALRVMWREMQLTVRSLCEQIDVVPPDFSEFDALIEEIARQRASGTEGGQWKTR